MLDADYLEQVTKDMEKAVGQMNDYLIEKIAKRIDALFRLNGEVKLIQSSIYDVRKAEQAGMLLEDIAVEVQKRLPHIEAEVKAAFLDAADKISVDTAERTREVIEVEHEIGNLADISLDGVTPFEAVGLPRDAENLNLTPKEIRLLESAYRQSRHDVKNFTRTMPNHGQDLYIRLCDEAYMKVRHGVSLDAAICEAIEGAAKQGISTVSYGGRTERAEVAIARAVRTGVNRASGDIVLCRCAEMGVNHVLVSQHLGARVTGTNDFRDHSQWQGKVYKLDWNKPALAKYQPTAEEEKENDRRFSFLSKIKNFLKRTFVKEYPDFIENCGYGEMLGICGINCRHTFTQFYPKINKNIQKPYDSEENRKKYETEQRQRAMERTIHKSMTKIKATEAVTQTPEVENELQRLRKLLDKQLDAYDKYCSDNRLSKQNYRIKAAGGRQVQPAKTNGRATAYKNEQYKAYEADLGKNMVSKSEFARIMSDRAEKKLFAHYSDAIKRGDVSPLADYGLYRRTAMELQDKCVGLVTSNGVKLEKRSLHCIDRVIGSVEQRRSGITVDDVVNTLISPDAEVRPVRYSKTAASQKFIYKNAEVTINPITKTLIQVNPHHREK